LIGITDRKEYDTDSHIAMTHERYLQLLEKEKLADTAALFLKKMEVFVMDRYVENYACFGNGGVIAYEELAKMLNVKLPKVAHIGAEDYLKIKNEVKNGKKEKTEV